MSHLFTLMIKKIIIYLFILISVNFFAQNNVIGCGNGLNGQVRGLYNDTVLNKLIVSGWFTWADGTNYNGLATWDGKKFDSLGTGNPVPYGGGIITRYKNKLYMFCDNLYLYSYDYQTKIWTQIPDKFNQRVNDLTIYNDELIIVGNFTKVGSTVVKNIIKYNGIAFDTLPKPLFSFYINTVETYKNELYIGGNFDPLPYTAIAKYDGSSWVKVSNNTSLTGASQSVNDLVIYNKKLYVTGNWSYTNGNFQPSLATWDGQSWGNIGTMIFDGGIPAANTTFKIHDNKLYVIGGFDSINNIKTANIAVWNDTTWCGVKMINNTGLQGLAIENYKNQWYFAGSQTMIADTVEITSTTPQDTINGLGIYVGNNGKLERNCFEKLPKQEITTEVILPQLISANSDGINDEIIIKLPYTQHATLLVFNRWGNLVYKAESELGQSEASQILRWNGTYDNKPLPSGTYFYVVESINTNKEHKNYRQFVELVR